MGQPRKNSLHFILSSKIPGIGFDNALLDLGNLPVVNLYLEVDRFINDVATIAIQPSGDRV
jgi:hypothetical protein